MKQEKIRVLHFPIRNTNGGVTRSAMKYWKFIDHDRFQFDFATCSKKLDFEQDIIDQGCGVHYISCYAEENEELFYQEFKKILLQGYDAVHLNTNWWRSFLAEQAAREVGVKIIVVHARSIFIDITDDRQREKELLQHEKCKREFPADLATHFLTCSSGAADFLYGSQIPKEKILTFHNALDVEKYSYDEQKRAVMRSTLNFDGKYVIGNVGRMCYAKNQLFLIDCFFEVQKHIENARLLIVGDGELKQALQERVDKYQINEKVLFTGTADNAEDYLQAMDIFALPSRFEGLPNVLIEAQTAGLKCIVSDQVTEEAKITDNVIFAELDTEKWVNAVLHFAEGYIRGKTDDDIRKAGYDIRYEIKVLEQIYGGCEDVFSKISV